jgi:hypothetical protein
MWHGSTHPKYSWASPLAHSQTFIRSSPQASSPGHDTITQQRFKDHNAARRDSIVEGGGSPVNDNVPVKGGGTVVDSASSRDLHVQPVIREGCTMTLVIRDAP